MPLRQGHAGELLTPNCQARGHAARLPVTAAYPLLADYRALLSPAEVRRFLAASLIGRIASSMISLGTLMLVVESTGSYGLAGSLTATVALARAAGAPLIGRLSDRLGQHRVLPPALTLHTLGVIGLIIAASAQSRTLYLFVAAAVAGAAFPPIGSMSRARWPALVRENTLLANAYALESVLDEVAFIAGPIVVALLATLVAPGAGLAAASTLGVVGGLAFASQRGSEPSLAAKPTGIRGRSAIRIRAFQYLALILLSLGVLFGSAEVSLLAFAEDHATKVLAGPLLAVLAVGSMLSGLVYGTRRWRLDLAPRLLVAVSAMFAGSLLLAVAPDIPWMFVASFLTGCAIAPTLIAGYGLTELHVPRRALTEGFTWIHTSIEVGVAVGIAAAGAVVNTANSQRAFLIGVAAAVIAVCVTRASQAPLRAPHGGTTS